jgi:hypothetical protein
MMITTLGQLTASAAREEYDSTALKNCATAITTRRTVRRPALGLDPTDCAAENTDKELLMTFTREQREAVEASGVVPMTIEGIECVVLRADVYDKVRTVLSDGLTHEELRGTLARSAQGSDWLDPAMDIYDEYDKHR